MSSQFNFTDNQWYNFICGFHAGLKLKDINLPNIDNSRLLYPIGIGGWANIGLAMPTLLYDENSSSMNIPVFTHDVDIDYSGFTVNIQWDSSMLRFNNVIEGEFGTIGGLDSSADIRYEYSNGVFKARGLKDRAVKYEKPIILFYINVTVLDTLTGNDAINLIFNNSSYSDLDYTTLLKWVDIGGGEWYTYFITPLINVNGAILGRSAYNNYVEQNSTTTSIGDESGTSVRATGSGVFIGKAFTAPGDIGVVPIYANSNIGDNFPYSGVHVNFTVEDSPDIFEYITVVGNSGFSLTVNRSSDESGYAVFDVIATRDEALIDSVTFCYIQYQIANTELSEYRIPLINNISELMN